MSTNAPRAVRHRRGSLECAASTAGRCRWSQPAPSRPAGMWSVSACGKRPPLHLSASRRSFVGVGRAARRSPQKAEAAAAHACSAEKRPNGVSGTVMVTSPGWGALSDQENFSISLQQQRAQRAQRFFCSSSRRASSGRRPARAACARWPGWRAVRRWPRSMESGRRAQARLRRLELSSWWLLQHRWRQQQQERRRQWQGCRRRRGKRR